MANDANARERPDSVLEPAPIVVDAHGERGRRAKAAGEIDVRQAAMLRFLDLLCKELGAEDARAELGGRDPDDPRLVWVNQQGGWRLVAVFAEPPESRAAKQAQLEQLVAGFSQTLGEVGIPSPPSLPIESPFRRLDIALEALRSRSGGIGVVIVDVHSPVLWGSSESQRHSDDVDTLVQIGGAIRTMLEGGIELDAICVMSGDEVLARLRDLGVEPERAGLLGRVLVQHDETALRHHLLTCLAVARAREEAERTPGPPRWAHHGAQFGYFVRAFANIYLLVVVFEGAFSELNVESGVVHALPAIEQLLLALPPLDPEPVAKGGRVIRLRR